MENDLFAPPRSFKDCMVILLEKGVQVRLEYVREQDGLGDWKDDGG